MKALKAGGDEDQMTESWSPAINLGASVLIPETYVEDLTLRLSLYRRLADIDTETEREAMAAEMIDRFGPLPEETEHLLEITAIKAPMQNPWHQQTRCRAKGRGDKLQRRYTAGASRHHDAGSSAPDASSPTPG